MSSPWTFNGVDDDVEASLEAYWAKKLPRLEKLLVRYPPDLRAIRLTVSSHHRNQERSWYEVRAVIHLPTGTLAAEASDQDPRVALDRVADELVTEIRRHRERVRHDYVFKRKTRNRAALSAAGPPLMKDVEHGRQDKFFRLLRSHLRFLRDQARRELRRLELDGTLHPEELTVDDLLDEVLVMAWQRFAERPRHLPLDLWLTHLLEEALEQWIEQEPRPHLSLAEKVKEDGPVEVPQVDEQEWWSWLLGYDEVLALEDLIPDENGTTAWEQLEAEEQRDHLLSLTGELPRAQRQAFLLHELEGYTTDEIAMLQDRPENQVKADIESARQTLRERLLAEGYVPAGSKLATANILGGK